MILTSPQPNLAWQFEGTTTDYVTGLTGTTTGSATYNSGGKYGQSLIMNGGANYIIYNLVNQIVLDTGFSICFWIKPLGLSSTAYIFDISATNFGDRIYGRLISNGTVVFNYLGSVTSLTTLSIGTWYHVVLSIGSGMMTVYVNGASPVQLAQSTTGVIIANKFSIGSLVNGSAPNLNAELDDMRIFDRVLTSAQVQSVYNQGGVPGLGTLTSQYIKSATGGDTVQDINGYRIHRFTTVGTSTFTPATSGAVEVLVVAGGGGGGGNAGQSHAGGGGGAGELIYKSNFTISGGISVTVGLGGTGETALTSSSWYPSTAGGNSSFGSLSANGGGRGGHQENGGSGGSGGGGGRYLGTIGGASTATTGVGNAGGGSGSVLGSTASAGSGGGAGGLGLYSYNDNIKTPGGPGLAYTISGSLATYAEGGAGGSRGSTDNGVAAVANTGSGGSGGSGASSSLTSGGNGGSGIVIVRYPLPIRLTGTSLFSQISAAATTSAVGAFSLRAVNGVTARAVAVQAHPVVQWPPTVLSGFTSLLSGQVYGNGTYTVSSSEIESGNTNRKSWNLFNIGTETALNGFYHSPISGQQPAAVFNTNSPNNYTGTATTTINGNSVSGLWIQLNAPTSIILKSYQMITRTSYSLDRFRFPSTYYIIGSNDATFATWVQLDYKSYTNTDYNILMTPIVVAGETRYQLTVNIVNYTPYIYYRLVVQNIISGDILNFSNFWLYGDSPSYAPNPSRDFYADRLGNLLTAPVTGQLLQNWLGAATGYVVTWYDQSGAGKDMTQTIAANQPVINLGTSPYSLIFNGTSTTMFNSNFTFNFGTNYQYTIRAVVDNTVGGCLLYKGVSGATWTTGAKKWWLATYQGGEASVGGFPNEVGNAEGYIFGQTAISSTKSSVTWSSSAYSSMILYKNASAVAVVYSQGGSRARSDPGNYLYIGSGGASTNYGGNIYEIEIFGSTIGLSDVTIMG